MRIIKGEVVGSAGGETDIATLPRRGSEAVFAALILYYSNKRKIQYFFDKQPIKNLFSGQIPPNFGLLIKSIYPIPHANAR